MRIIVESGRDLILRLEADRKYRPEENLQTI